MPKNWKEKTIEYAIKNFWKIILIILALGIAVAGFKFQLGPLACDKQGIPLKLEERPEK